MILWRATRGPFTRCPFMNGVGCIAVTSRLLTLAKLPSLTKVGGVIIVREAC